MSWEINYSNQSLEDLKSIFEYIVFKLFSPNAAHNQVNRIIDSVNTLDEMPMRYKIYENATFMSKGLRVLPIDNYIVLYLPIEKMMTINVIRILYSRRNVMKLLEEK